MAVGEIKVFRFAPQPVQYSPDDCTFSSMLMTLSATEVARGDPIIVILIVIKPPTAPLVSLSGTLSVDEIVTQHLSLAQSDYIIDTSQLRPGGHTVTANYTMTMDYGSGNMIQCQPKEVSRFFAVADTP